MVKSSSFSRHFYDKIETEVIDSHDLAIAYDFRPNIRAIVNNTILSRALALRDYRIMVEHAHYNASGYVNTPHNRFVHAGTLFLTHIAFLLGGMKGFSSFTVERGAARNATLGDFEAIRNQHSDFYNILHALLTSETPENDLAATFDSIAQGAFMNIISKDLTPGAEMLAQLMPQKIFLSAQYVNKLRYFADSYHHMEDIMQFVYSWEHTHVRMTHAALIEWASVLNASSLSSVQRDGLESVAFLGPREAFREHLARYSATFAGKGFVVHPSSDASVSLFDMICYAGFCRPELSQASPTGQLLLNIFSTTTPMPDFIPGLYHDRHVSTLSYVISAGGDPNQGNIWDPKIGDSDSNPQAPLSFNLWHAITAAVTIENGYTIDEFLADPTCVREYRFVDSAILINNAGNLRTAYQYVLSAYRILRDLFVFRFLYSSELNDSMTSSAGISRVPYPALSTLIQVPITDLMMMDVYKYMMEGINLMFTAHYEAIWTLKSIFTKYLPTNLPDIVNANRKLTKRYLKEYNYGI